jgi:hypothetical protein
MSLKFIVKKEKEKDIYYLYINWVYTKCTPNAFDSSMHVMWVLCCQMHRVYVHPVDVQITYLLNKIKKKKKKRCHVGRGVEEFRWNKNKLALRDIYCNDPGENVNHICTITSKGLVNLEFPYNSLKIQSGFTEVLHLFFFIILLHQFSSLSNFNFGRILVRHGSSF